MRKHHITGKIDQNGYRPGSDKKDGCACDLVWTTPAVGDTLLGRWIDALLPADNINILEDDEYDPHYETKQTSVQAGYRFYISNTPFKAKSIEEIDGEYAGIAMGAIPWAGACYSAATCGFGEWNTGWFGGHSLYAELSNYHGKYVFLEVEVSD